MNPQTRKAFNNYKKAIANSYEIAEEEISNFSLTEPKASAFQDAIEKSTSFLSEISNIPVIESTGDIFTFEINDPLATRTDTYNEDRSGTSLEPKDHRTYECKHTEFDATLQYATIDSMAIFPEFKSKVQKSINTRIGIDQLMIGFNGTSHAAKPNRTTNPLLQDMNTGWIQDLKNSKPSHHIATASIGETGTYANLDEAVNDLLSIIPQEHRINLAVLIGNELIAEYNSNVWKKFGTQPTEKLAASNHAKSFADLPVKTPTGFPPRAIMIVAPKNLIHYYQISSIRKMISDNPKRNRIEHFTSLSECYRIANINAAAVIQEITPAQ